MIRWRPDLEVFTDINIPLDFFRDTMHRQAVVNPGITFKLRLQGADGKFTEQSFVYPNGISDYDYLNIVTEDGSRIMCGNGNTFGKKRSAATNQDHDEILGFIREKNESVRLGYDQDNLAAFNELKKK